MKLRRVLSLVLMVLAASACATGAATPQPQVVTPQLPQPSPTTVSGQTETPAGQASEGPALYEAQFTANSPLCTAVAASGSLQLACTENQLQFSQADGRKRVDAYAQTQLPLAAESVSLHATVQSDSSSETRVDQNNYGLYLLMEDGSARAVRLAGQFFAFETWGSAVAPAKPAGANLAFSPDIKPASLPNDLRLDCSRAACDFFVNGTLVGRSSTGLPAKISDIGIFATSGWDQRFGQVTFTRFSAFELPGKTPIEPLNLGSALTSDEGLFASTGLSGAFHSYEADGFHFSPVIPFGYYSVKGGPALADMTVSADIKMEIQPGVSASRFAGLVCRASQSGMVAAVIRADGTYTVFRDTPRQPLAVLARGATDVLLPGLSENKLRLECRGSEIRFFINDALVESLNDTRYGLTFGRAGLFTKAGGDANPDAIVFRGFSVTEIME